MSGARLCIETGSSPLARGTLHERGLVRGGGRFIPARAGNTSAPGCWPSSSPVHPRSRGEHRRRALGGNVQTGSSPLARGTRVLLVLRREGQRFIPARAGNTPPRPGQGRRVSVHPRSRGEHRQRPPLAERPVGSSPLARGTHLLGASRLADGRFIPARAGNTPTQRTAASHRTGSSPLARGTHVRMAARPAGARFIPARAGNTRGGRAEPTGPAVHPRSRGEHPPRAVLDVPRLGSSPLARGTQRWSSDEAPGGRFIPARAGNTVSTHSSGSVATVHPRSRGEHPRMTLPTARWAGSSPLARGTPRDRNPCQPIFRFIPARAGNTLLVTY